jgi:hypothetical protein
VGEVKRKRLKVTLRSLRKKAEKLSLTLLEIKRTVMLKPFSASHPLVQSGEILNQVQDDRSGKFQICLVHFLLLFLLFGCAVKEKTPPPPSSRGSSLPPHLEQRVLSLDPESLSEKDVSEVLSR